MELSTDQQILEELKKLRVLFESKLTFKPVKKERPTKVKKEKPVKEKPILFCPECKIHCRTDKEFYIHKQTTKHKYASGEIIRKTEFNCEKCNYTTKNKQHLDRHLSTVSHINK